MASTLSLQGCQLALETPRRLTNVTSWHRHIPFAFALVELLEPQIIVELGTQRGDSYCAFCQAVDTLRIPARCFAVDSWRGDEHAGHYGPQVLDELRAYHDPLYGEFSTLVQSQFDDALTAFADGSIDLLHIDGFHTYEAVRHDFDSWLPKMAPGGVVLLHDTTLHRDDFGVFRLWDELASRYPAFQFPYGFGLGVVAVGRQVPPELLRLATDAEYAAQITDYFSRLGDRVAALEPTVAPIVEVTIASRDEDSVQGEGAMTAHSNPELQSAGWDLGVTLQRLATIDDFGRLIGSLGTRRVEVERHIGTAHREQESWTMAGYCEVCQAAASFRMGWEYSDHVVPNYREHLQCPSCGLNNRQRFVASYLARLVGEKRRDVYLHDQVSPVYRWAKQHLTQCTVTGREYLGPSVAPGSVIDGIRHEDALNLTFPSESLDVIVSTDVYEHVPDIEKTIAEARRVLRPGGTLLFSVPFFAGSQQTIQRAALDASGQVLHLHPPQYHGNPISPDEGSLVFYDYGWDLLDLFRGSGFRDAYALAYYSYFYGYLGEGLQLVFVAER